jgi:hypothetical protein
VARSKTLKINDLKENYWYSSVPLSNFLIRRKKDDAVF